MLEIKTVSNQIKADFDAEVNAALREGWELVRRDCLILGSDHHPILYAELERIIDESEETSEDDSIVGFWEITRDPKNPYRCSKCGYTAREPWLTCPDCHTFMVTDDESEGD